MEMENNQNALPRQHSTPQNQTPQTPWTQQYQPKPLFQLTKTDTAFAICGVIVSIFTAIFGIFGGFALGYLLSSVCMMVLFAAYFAKGGKVRPLPTVYGLLALANGAVFICTTNGSVRFFGVIVSLLLLFVCFDGLVNGGTKGNRQTVHLFYRAAATVDNIDITVKTLFSNANGDKKMIGKVLIGLLCAVPVLIIVVPLLVASDDAFRGMLKNIFSNSFTTVFRTVFGVVLSIFVTSYGFSLKKGRTAKVKTGKFAGIENVYILSFLSAIGACYLLYLFSQLAYFFSAFRGFLPDGEITYAQYARKGFFEMCVIAVINLVMVFTALLLAKKQTGKVCHGIKALTTFIAVFTLIIIATAISKMVLYIDAYGMTVRRVTTSAFMLFLSVVFISVILRIYSTKINVVKVALLAAGCIVLMLGTVNVNRVCAKYNYESYRTGRLAAIDIEALYDLGDEGIPYIVHLAADENKAVAQGAKRYLAEAYLYDYFDDMADAKQFTVDELKQNRKDKGFERFSIPKAVAYDSLYQFLEDHRWFSAECQKYLETAE